MFPVGSGLDPRFATTRASSSGPAVFALVGHPVPPGVSGSSRTLATQDAQAVDALHNIHVTFPAPVHLKFIDVPKAVSVEYTDEPVGYTDCAEISLLR